MPLAQIVACLCLPAAPLGQTTAPPIETIAYRPDAPDDYARSRCTLDVYVPAAASSMDDSVVNGGQPLPSIVWFHGGGLTAGEKSIPAALQRQGVIVVAANYRLSPQANVRDCIDDAAAAVAWTLDHIAEHGGDRAHVFVAGHSAGGYLASMVGLDASYLAVHGHEPSEIAGLIPFSGHTITHFTARKEAGIPGTQPVIDELAPLFHVAKTAPAMLLITGDRDLELLGRYEETAYFWRMMQVVEHPDCTLHELDGYDHGSMPNAAFPLLLNFVRDRT